MIRYGFDFGTTNSSIALLTDGTPHLVPIDNLASDPAVIRSLLYFFHRDLVCQKGKNGKETWVYQGEFRYAFGQQALSKYLFDNKNRTSGITRQVFTGRMVQVNASPNAPNADLVAEYYEDVDYGTGRLLHALKTALKSPVYKGTNIFGKFFTLEQMIGLFVSLLKVQADSQTKEKIARLRVGRPVHFLDSFEKDKAVEDRLKEGLKMVGFTDIQFEFEPVAAAKYFLHKFALHKKKIFVFDFGGGTLDTAIVQRNDSSFQVLATDGIYIGGNLLNSLIMKAKLNKYFGSDIVWGKERAPLPINFINSLNSWYGVINLNNPSDMRFLAEIKNNNSDPKALERLSYLIKMNLGFEIYEAIETAKKSLSDAQESTISFRDGPIDINLKLTRLEFEDLIAPQIEDIKKVVLNTLKLARSEPDEIEVVVRTGGSSLIPVVERMLADIFGKEKVQLFDTFTSIAAGLALE